VSIAESSATSICSSVTVAASVVASMSTAACFTALADLMSLGGPSLTIGFGTSDSACFAVRPFFEAVRRLEVPLKIFPAGSSICRSLATRSTNCLATISSIVLEALLTSIPCSRLSRSMTS
jgi:hypothetical protein